MIKKIGKEKRRSRQIIGKLRKWFQRNSEVEEDIWKDKVKKDTYEKSLGLCHRFQRDIQT